MKKALTMDRAVVVAGGKMKQEPRGMQQVHRGHPGYDEFS
jgi:hypothetical protein